MDTQNELISVIMPCFNAAAFVAEAVQSVMNQTYRNVELVIVDDGSIDESKEILKGLVAHDPERIRVYHQENKGPYPARNLALEHANGRYIAFLDADDYWRPDCLAQLHAALSNSDAALAYCGWQNVGVPGRRGEPYIPPNYESNDKAEQFLRTASPWPIHAALVRKSVLAEVGGFDLQWSSCMDYDLWLRIAVSRPIVLVPEVLAFYRHHTSGQITSTQWRQARNAWLVKRKFVRDHPASVKHLSKKKIRELLDEGLLKRGYDNFWRRDITSAQRIFRMALLTRAWKAKDLPYILPALLPENIFKWIVSRRDR